LVHHCCVTTPPVYEELAELALAGRGWPAILARLAAVAGTSARLIGVHGGILAAAPVPDDVAGAGVDSWVVAGVGDTDTPTELTCGDGWKGEAVALRAGPRRVGVLALESPLDDDQRAALFAARVPVCIEAVRRDAEAATRAESASRLIDEVRFGLLRDPAEVERVAERFSVALGRPHVAAVFAYDGANERTWATALSWIETPVRQDRGVGWTILAADERELTRIRTRLQGMVGDDADVLAACGSVVDDVHDTARSFFEAEAALALLRRGGRGPELRFSTLGLSGVLLSVPRERLREFVDDQLGPILERTDLLDTLVAWLDTNGSRAAVAHRLDIHRNSVGYRMGRIRQLLACDPVEPAAALQIRAALVAREMLAVLDELHEGQRGEPVNPLTE
jgi:hypothetical protein